ncbi:MAG: helix-turn-helix transcriptional regulator [Bacillota bacterium]
MDFVRIGDKIVSREKIDEAIDDILIRRAKGFSQAEVAGEMGLDRTFISRLETLGELRKGGSIALVGFPLANCEDVKKVAKEEGVEFIMVMNDEERWSFVKGKTGADLLNDLMGLIGSFRKYHKVILIGSDKRLEIMKGLLDKNTEVVTVVIGRSPMSRDVTVDPESLRETIRNLKG